MASSSKDVPPVEPAEGETRGEDLGEFLPPVTLVEAIFPGKHERAHARIHVQGDPDAAAWGWSVDELIIFQKCEELTQKVKNLEEVLESVTAERDMLVTMLQNANMQRDRAITQANMWRDEYQAPVAEEEKQSVAGHKRSFISENHLSIIICNFGALVS